MIQLINTSEAAQILGVTPLHVRRLLREGKLAGQKIGRDWLMFKPRINKDRGEKYTQR